MTRKMFLCVTLVFLATAIRAASHSHGPKCGAEPIGKIGEEAINDALTQFRRDNTRRTAITVPTCFHVLYPVGGNESAQNLADEVLQAQLDLMNEAFSSSSCCDTSTSWCTPGTCSADSGITFAMAGLVSGSVTGATVESVAAPNACVTRTANDAWAVPSQDFPSSQAHTDMKTELKKGGFDTLNVYFNDLSADGLLGFATYPWYDNIISDGVVNTFNSLPGFGGAYGEGDTLVHEVGHWLGLPHTFNGGCTTSDGISDTPVEASPYGGCSPEDQTDTCPDSPGIDPIHNFMDYSDDVCLFEFTEGQVEIMQAVHDYWRLKNLDDSANEIALELSIPSDPITIISVDTQLFTLTTTKCCVICQSESTEGDVDMYVNLNSAPTFSSDDFCVSDSGSSDETCTINNPSSPVREEAREFAASSGGFYAAFCFGGGNNGEPTPPTPAPSMATCNSDNTCESTKIFVGIKSFPGSHGSDVVVTCS